MRHYFIAGVALLWLSGSALAADNIELLERCSEKDPKTGELYIPAKNLRALSRLLTDPVLADNSEGCKASMSAAERAKYENTRKVAADRRFKDLQDIQARTKGQTRTPGVPAEAVSSALDFKPESDAPPIIVRDAYNVFSLNQLLAAKNNADGASFTYTRDFQNDNVLTALTGSVFGWFDIFPEPKDADKIKPFDHVIIAPGIQFDQQRNNANPSKNIDYLAPTMLTEFQLPGNEFRHLFRFAGYLKTDSKGESKIWGGYAEWQPVSNIYGISSGHPIFKNAPLYYRFDPILHVETESVATVGNLTDVNEGDRYARAGPILQANLWFARGPELLKRLTFAAQYRHLWGSTNPGRQKDLDYWQATLGYNLDTDGHAAITTTYRQGNLPGNNQEARDFKTGLAVKF